MAEGSDSITIWYMKTVTVSHYYVIGEESESITLVDEDSESIIVWLQKTPGSITIWWLKTLPK